MLYTDKPIEKGEDDKLNRNGFAKLFARSILNFDNKDTFTVGLFGKWGSGKTSIVNMLLREIEQRKENIGTIIIRFEPWNFSDTNNLLTQFFLHLSNTLKSNKDKNLQQAGEAIEKFAPLFESAASFLGVGPLAAVFTKVFEASAKEMKNGAAEQDILKQKENIINLLEKQSHKILVVIDDIDRLNSEQIRQVFQLITAVARFPKTIYLVIFDRDIVVKALKDVQKGNGDDYLEKVIQMPIQIPEISKSKLREILFGRLGEIRGKYTEVNFLEEHWKELFKTCIDPYIKSLRDVNRLCNSVWFKLSAIAQEVDFVDLVAISALEIFQPLVYEWVKANKSVLIGSFDPSNFDIKERSQDEWRKLYTEQILAWLSNSDEDAAKNFDIEAIIRRLSQLFPYFGRKIGESYRVVDNSSHRKDNRIAHTDKFDRYFNLDLDSVSLKKADIFNAVHNFTIEEFKDFLLKVERSGIGYEFLGEIEARLSEISSERAKIIITALLESLNQLNNSGFLMRLSAKDEAEYIMIDMVDLLPINERVSFMAELIKTSTMETLFGIMDLVNIIELAYGRLAANGNEQGYKKVVTLEELISLESMLTGRMREMLKFHRLFDFSEWEIIYYFLDQLDHNFINKYLKSAFESTTNILSYMISSVSILYSHTERYEIKNDYKEYLTTEEVMSAIQKKRDAGTLFDLPKNVQNKCAAFFLQFSSEQYRGRCIYQSDVDNLLTSWKREINTEQ